MKFTIYHKDYSNQNLFLSFKAIMWLKGQKFAVSYTKINIWYSYQTKAHILVVNYSDKM